MKENPLALEARKPVHVLKKSISADFKGLSASIAKAIGRGALGNWEEAASATADAIAALGVETQPEELAFILVKRALTAAIFELLTDSIGAQLSDLAEDAVKAVDRMNLPELDIQIDSTFMDRPASLELLVPLASSLKEWLVETGIEREAAENTVARLPAYFTYALSREWQRGKKSYHPILEFFETPFAKAGEREWAWRQYFALLKKRIGESVFNESFSLEQIYVPLNAYYLLDSEGMKDRLEPKGRIRHEKFRVVVQLEETLVGWLRARDSTDAVRVISGGPGSGKSSFSKIFAAKLAEQGTVRPLFIPLHLIDATKDLVEEVGNFVRDEGILSFNPLHPDSADKELLVIFDGLDELASQGKHAAETARAFVHEVERVANRINSTKLRLRVLISGREVVVQENEAEFRRPQQILNVLPYFVGSPEDNAGRQSADKSDYYDENGLLDTDLRSVWWEKYGALTGRNYSGLPGPLDRRDLDEVTAQPLLNYLVALSYTREKVDFGKDVNLNSVYGDLVAAVHERGYEKRGSYGPIRHMTVQQFVRVLEEVGLAAWHGDGRSTTVREIEEHCKTSGLGGLLALFKEGAEAGVTRLLAAFFFRQHGQRVGGDPTFVFTHKSFGEYLAANRIVRAMEKICKERERRFEDLDEGWDDRDALAHWAQISGPSEVTPYLHVFLANEIKIRRPEIIAVWQKHFSDLFSYLLRHGMPMERYKFLSFKDAMFQARNAEESLLAALNACSSYIGVVANIEHSDPTVFGAWFRRIQGQRTSPESCLAARCLSYLNLSGCALDIGDYYGADFSCSNLSGVAAHYSCFYFANFAGADLSGAVFSGSSFYRANFTNATAVSTRFDDALLERAIVEGVDFAGARIDIKRKTDLELNAEQLGKIEWLHSGRPAASKARGQEIAKQRLIAQKTSE